ncbi:MAG: EamA family transporter [Desulfovibrio sp.]|uniref:DMT family transporter n=1 Tax=Desulfovibrio sp. TaxID=885 RepID=UPI001A6C85D1|nr:EamA family transporter [Desulfovibrio sp.]MBD5418372.1 EamA family transporter [Desulfovibrio sp.]
MAKNSLENILFGNACILTATIFWGVNYPFTKALIPDFMSSAGVAAFRVMGGCLLFWLSSLFIKGDTIEKQDFLKIVIGGALGLFGCIYLFVIALDYGSAIDIAIIMTLQPAFVMLIEIIFLHRRPDLTEYAGLAISFIGAALIILTGHTGTSHANDLLLGDFFAVCAGICFAIYLVILQKPTQKYKPISLLRWVFLFAALPGLFLVPDLPAMAIWKADELVPWLEIGFIVLCPTFLAYLLVQPASKAIGSVLVALYQYLTPVVAALAAIWMGVDHLRWAQVVAMLVIIAGMLLTNWGKIRQRN